MLSNAILSASLLLFATTAHADVASDMVEWVKSKGGSFNDKLEIRRVDPSDKDSTWGVFAIDDIEPKEELMHIPPECYISIWDEAEHTDFPDQPLLAQRAYHRNMCNLSYTLKNEMELGTDSDFVPFLNFIKTEEKGQLPANWSPEGKDLLRKIFSEGKDVVDWIDWNFKEKGCIDEDDDSDMERMVEITVHHSVNNALIPIWQAVNHNNAKLNTQNTAIYNLDGLRVRAAIDIKKGDEVYGSYDLCVDCFEASDYQGTPEILKNFGVVEPYPQRYSFEDYGIWFEVWPRKDGGLGIIFDTDEDYNTIYGREMRPYGVPDIGGIKFLEDILERLEGVEKEHLVKGQGNIPDKEWKLINQFHEASTKAMYMAIGGARVRRRL